MVARQKKNEAVPPEPSEPGFEDNLKKLESIVTELEQGNIPLDKAMALYQEGIAAYRACSEALKNAEARVAKLVETLEGELKEEPFEAEPDAEQQ
jgi:exodeoxyribonuclease VII small subunit